MMIGKLVVSCDNLINMRIVSSLTSTDCDVLRSYSTIICVCIGITLLYRFCIRMRNYILNRDCPQLMGKNEAFFFSWLQWIMIHQFKIILLIYIPLKAFSIWKNYNRKFYSTWKIIFYSICDLACFRMKCKCSICVWICEWYPQYI